VNKSTVEEQVMSNGVPSRQGDTDRNLLFGVLALQVDLIDSQQFVEACASWAARKDVPLADLLVERGWLTPTDKADVERLLERKLKKHRSDPRASLAAVADVVVFNSLAGLNDPDIQRSLVDLPRDAEHVSVATVDHVPDPRARYSLPRLHATGGIGRVWLAHDEQLNREIALKELKPEQADNPIAANRQLIAHLLPTADRSAFVALDRHLIASFGVGPGSFW
jgi:hypothetical protein